jgi:hypothetical protein
LKLRKANESQKAPGLEIIEWDTVSRQTIFAFNHYWTLQNRAKITRTVKNEIQVSFIMKMILPLVQTKANSNLVRLFKSDNVNTFATRLQLHTTPAL